MTVSTDLDWEYEPLPGKAVRINNVNWELGGLRFKVFFTVGHGIGRGATCQVFASQDGNWTQVMRFDDFVGEPHFHVPADGPQIELDAMDLESTNGNAIAWFGTQVRDHLVELLDRGGFRSVVENIDQSKLAENADKLREAMESSAPDEQQLARELEIWRSRWKGPKQKRRFEATERTAYRDWILKD